MPTVTVTSGNSSSRRAAHRVPSRTARDAAPSWPCSGSTTATSVSRTEMIASGARVVRKLSAVTAARRSRSSPGTGPALAASNATDSTWCSPAGVVAEVPGPSAGLRPVLAAAGQQALDQVVPHPAGGRGHHPLPAEDDPADGGRVLGEQQAGVLPGALARRCPASAGARARHRRPAPAPRSPRRRCPPRAGAAPGGPGSRRRAPRRAAGGRRGRGRPGRPAHRSRPGAAAVRMSMVGLTIGHRRAGLLGDQPGHRGDVGVLDRQPGQVAVHRDEVAQGENLAHRLAARARAGARARAPARPPSLGPSLPPVLCLNTKICPGSGRNDRERAGTRRHPRRRPGARASRRSRCPTSDVAVLCPVCREREEVR